MKISHLLRENFKLLAIYSHLLSLKLLDKRTLIKTKIISLCKEVCLISQILPLLGLEACLQMQVALHPFLAVLLEALNFRQEQPL